MFEIDTDMSHYSLEQRLYWLVWRAANRIGVIESRLFWRVMWAWGGWHELRLFDPRDIKRMFCSDIKPLFDGGFTWTDEQAPGSRAAGQPNSDQQPQAPATGLNRGEPNA